MIDAGEFIRVFAVVTAIGVTVLVIGELSSEIRRSQHEVSEPTSARKDAGPADQEKRLVPSWYLARYRADEPAWFGNNQLVRTAFALGLFLYPIWGIGFTRLRYEQFISRGGRGFLALLDAQVGMRKRSFSDTRWGRACSYCPPPSSLPFLLHSLLLCSVRMAITSRQISSFFIYTSARILHLRGFSARRHGKVWLTWAANYRTSVWPRRSRCRRV